MNRRSFLAALGVAPVVASSALAAPHPALQAGTVTTEMFGKSSAITRNWSCPDFKAERAQAAKTGRELQPEAIRTLTRSEAPEWLQTMMPEWQDSVFTASHRGRIVQAMWWLR